MNKTITIYELLGMIKDGKAPKKIKFDNDVYTFCMKDEDYINKNNDYDGYLIMDRFMELPTNSVLNTIVEIIEDNDKSEKIEKLDDRYYDEINKCFGGRQMLGETVLVDKINELIDYINKIEQKLDEK